MYSSASSSAARKFSRVIFAGNSELVCRKFFVIEFSIHISAFHGTIVQISFMFFNATV